MKLSGAMAAAIVEIQDHGGVIHRHATGEWTVPGASKPFVWTLPDVTVAALIARVELLVIQRDGRGRPIAARIKDGDQ